jgi:hypothetical protein
VLVSALDKTIETIEKQLKAKIDESDFFLRAFKRLELEVLELKETKAELEAIRSKQ